MIDLGEFKKILIANSELSQITCTLEIIDRTITAEKATKFLAEELLKSIEGCSSATDGCPAYDYCCPTKGNNISCPQILISWAMKEARAQG